MTQATLSADASTHTDNALAAGAIAARLDRLPPTYTVWKLIVLCSASASSSSSTICSITGYVAPGLVKAGILTPTTPGLFGNNGVASFVAALFAGLFIGTIACGFLADRFGRRAIFTFSLLWYTAANVVMAFQDTAFGLDLWRFIVGPRARRRDHRRSAPICRSWCRSMCAAAPSPAARRIGFTAVPVVGVPRLFRWSPMHPSVSTAGAGWC